MTRPLHKIGLGLVSIALVLSGCNGQEDFEDAVVGGNPVGGGGSGANFQAGDACASRVTGVLVDTGVVKNITYRCDGFYGRTGETGLEHEKEQNFFVCPLSARSVDFLLGGKTASLKLGTAYFRVESPANSGCAYDSSTETYSAGGYDAAGPYLLSVGDLFESPGRADVITDSAAHETQAQNISALLQGLDGVPGNATVDIADAAHTVIFQELVSFADPVAFLSQPFADFVSSTGEAQQYLDDVADYIAATPAEEGAVGSLPVAEAEAEAALRHGNGATAAGLYRTDLLIHDYGLFGYFAQGSETIYKQDALLTDSLPIELSKYLFDPAATEPESSFDFILSLALTGNEYLPFMLVDRHQRISGGGAYDVVRFGSSGSTTTYRCPGQMPTYMALSDSAALQPDLTFSNLAFTPVSGAGSISILGRFIAGAAYSGIAASGGITDYELDYGELPESAHAFTPETDRTLIDSTICDTTVDDQIMLGMGRVGIVEPVLDTDIMSEFFATPAAYTISYTSRVAADDAEPNTSTPTDLNVTIHQDGSVYTDLDNDGNDESTFTPPAVPPGEYAVGMVTSVFPGEDDTATAGVDESVTEATMNLVLFNFGPAGAAGTIPKYGSHLRARLVPDTAATCDNRMFAASSATTPATAVAVWYDPYNITAWLSANSTASNDAKYEAVRTRAYGYVTASLTSCP